MINEITVDEDILKFLRAIILVHIRTYMKLRQIELI